MRARLERWVGAAAVLVPEEHRSWIEWYAAEIQAIGSDREAVRWVLGAVPVISRSLLAAVVRDPLSFVGGALIKTVVATLGVVALIGGLALAGMFAFASGVPVVVLVLAAALMVQGGYVLAYLNGALRRFEPFARYLLLIGSTLAALVGFAAFAQAVVFNVRAANPDPEFGPMTVALVITAVGLVSLLAFASDTREGPPRGDPSRL